MFFSLNETGDGLTPRLTFNGLNACFVTKIAMMHMAEIPAVWLKAAVSYSHVHF
jgi:hypothetical protein